MTGIDADMISENNRVLRQQQVCEGFERELDISFNGQTFLVFLHDKQNQEKYRENYSSNSSLVVTS